MGTPEVCPDPIGTGSSPPQEIILQAVGMKRDLAIQHAHVYVLPHPRSFPEEEGGEDPLYAEDAAG